MWKAQVPEKVKWCHISGSREVRSLQAGEIEDTWFPTLVLCCWAKVSEMVCLGFLNIILETQQARNLGRDVLGIAFRWAASHICPSNVVCSVSSYPRGGKYPSGLRQAEVSRITASPITFKARLGQRWGLGMWENSSASFYWLQQALRGAVAKRTDSWAQKGIMLSMINKW